MMGAFQWSTSEICAVSIENGDEIVASFTNWAYNENENDVCKEIKRNHRQFDTAAELLKFLRKVRENFPELAGAVLYTGGAGAMRLTRRGTI